MQLDTPRLVHLDWPGCFTGMAGMHPDGTISFIPNGRAQTGLTTTPITLDGVSVTLFVTRAAGDERARPPLLLAKVVTTA